MYVPESTHSHSVSGRAWSVMSLWEKMVCASLMELPLLISAKSSPAGV